MIQSQQFLSQLGIAYGFCGSQADVDAFAQAVIASYNAKKVGTYTSPNAVGGGSGNMFDNVLSLKHWAAIVALNAAIQAGDVAMAHDDLDRANQFAGQCGMPIVPCPRPDIEILCNAPGWTGRTAQMVGAGQLPQLDDLDKAGTIIAVALAASPMPPAPPQSTTPAYIDLDGPLAGYVIGQILPSPDGTWWAYSVLPFGPHGESFRLVRVPKPMNYGAFPVGSQG